MANFSRIVRFDAVRTEAFGAITAAYLPLGTPLTHVTRLIKFINTTDSDVQVSFDGATLHDIVPVGGFSLYDFVSDGDFVMAIGTQIFIKSAVASTLGSFSAITIYGQGE